MTKEKMIALGQKIQKKRTKKKLSQIELARAIGVSQSLVSKMENGNGLNKIDSTLSVLKFLGIPTSILNKYVFNNERTNKL